MADLDDIASGKVSGYVLMNSTSIGMHPEVGATPVPKAALSKYRLVFDAVYTPVETQLLKVRALTAAPSVYFESTPVHMPSNVYCKLITGRQGCKKSVLLIIEKPVSVGCGGMRMLDCEWTGDVHWASSSAV